VRYTPETPKKKKKIAAIKRREQRAKKAAGLSKPRSQGGVRVGVCWFVFVCVGCVNSRNLVFGARVFSSHVVCV
jgi:ribosomal protein L44E